MNKQRWKQIDDLFDAVLGIPESEREEYLKDACQGDEELNEKVLALLQATTSNQFLESSAMGVAVRNLAVEHEQAKEDEYLGRVFGTYQVERLIGSGGMGQVYVATDSKFDRKIALKIIPSVYNSDADRLKRFELEARAISCLNHPNIVTIYDIGNNSGINYLATEFVEGKNLREIGRKLETNEVLNIVIQICEALSAAHGSGIIHRDIKPENIMVRPDGYVKVLDFGLAKLGDNSVQTSEDRTKTAEGMIVGTPGYMSPEQVADEMVDYRTDLWSLGVIAYELLTGVNPFKKANRQGTFQAILSNTPPPPSSINPEVSHELDQIITKALEKNSELRFQTATDIHASVLAIPDTHNSGKAQLAANSTLTPGLQKYTVSIALISFIISVLGIAAWFYFNQDRQVPVAPDWSKAKNIQLTEHSGTEYFPSLAPDGKSFVYASDKNGNFDIFLQNIGSKTSISLTSDTLANDTQPSFSPDGQEIAFRSEREPTGIYVMRSDGESPRRVSDFGFHPSWSPDGKNIVVSNFGYDQPNVRTSGTPGIWILDIEAGSRRELSKLDGSFPAWSPNGKFIAFWYYPEVGGRRDVAVVSADKSRETIVTKDFATSNWNPVWSPDGRFLYFVSDRNGNLNFWRVAMNADSGEVIGTPEPVVSPSTYSRHLNFSRDGNQMIYVQTNVEANLQGVAFDAENGKTIREPYWITSGDRELTRSELSPDGTQFLMRQIRRTQDDIVIFDRTSKSWQDVTNDTPFDRYPRWSPDGNQIAFVSDRSGNYEIWICGKDGSGMSQITFVGETETGTSFPAWSPDGKRLLYSVNRQTYIVDLDKSWTEQSHQNIPDPPVGRFLAWDWSPDGKKLAGNFVRGAQGLGFYSFETGEFTHVTETSAGETVPIPSWLPNSRDFVYVDGNVIRLTNTESKKTTELLSFKNEEVRTPFVSRDGTLLYYIVYKSQSDLWLLDNSMNK